MRMSGPGRLPRPARDWQGQQRLDAILPERVPVSVGENAARQVHQVVSRTWREGWAGDVLAQRHAGMV